MAVFAVTEGKLSAPAFGQVCVQVNISGPCLVSTDGAVFRSADVTCTFDAAAAASSSHERLNTLPGPGRQN